MGDSSRVRIILADDHSEFLETVQSMLEPSFEIIGRAGDGQALFEAATKLKPDVIVTDISMPILSGIEAAYKLKESGCTAKIVFLTVHTDSEFVSACLATGASGYVVKPRMAADLLTAIQEALAERVFISTHPTNEKLASHASSD